MKILIAYATNSSGTLVASQTILSVLNENGHEVIQRDIRNVKAESLSLFDLVIFGSPSWNYNKTEGQPHEFITQFINSMEGQELPNKLFAVFGLGDTAYMYFCGAVDHIEEFITRLKGALLLPSLRIDGFYFNQHENEILLTKWSEEITEKLHSLTSHSSIPLSKTL